MKTGEEIKEREFKIITLGESGVGKTSLINRICKEFLVECVDSTFAASNNILVREYPKKK